VRTAPVTTPLNTVIANADGRGFATTAVEGVTPAELFGTDEERFILLHAKIEQGKEFPPGNACADLVQTTGPDVQSSALPESGGPHLETLLYIGTTLVSTTVDGFFALWIARRRYRSSTALLSELA
jgi:hypothetical protein